MPSLGLLFIRTVSIGCALILFIFILFLNIKHASHWKRRWCWERLKAEGEGVAEDDMVGWHHQLNGHAAAAKSLQSCPTLCDPRDGSPPGSTVPGILQARTLEWAAISFSSAWKWKVKVKSLSRVWLFATPWTSAYQAPLSMGFSRQEYWSGVPLPSLQWTWVWANSRRQWRPEEPGRLLSMWLQRIQHEKQQQ